MTSQPQILVLARPANEREKLRLARAFEKQTYTATSIYFVNDEAVDLKKEKADYILVWTGTGELQPAAIEKLLLALCCAPDQLAVADIAHGANGLFLLRNTEKTRPLVSLWFKSHAAFIEECQASKPAFFFINESLVEGEAPTFLPGLEEIFAKLPFDFKNLQQITTEPIWEIAPESVDNRSVLFLVTSLPMGGACKFILDVTSQLKSQGYRVTVATTTYDTHNPNPWLNELLNIVPDTFVLSHVRPVELPRLVAHLARTRNCGRVVLSHCMLGNQILPWLRTQLPEVAFLDYTHIEYESEWPDGGYALRAINNLPLLDLAVVSSNHLCNWMTTHGADAEKIRVCHTNIDAQKWIPSEEVRAFERLHLDIDNQTAMILYPCRLAEQKRPELLCNIVAALRRTTKAPFKVVVAGSGPLAAPLKNFIAREGLEDCVKLLGAVPLDRIIRLHNAADIFLLPSLIEGIALALFEAMAMESVPVISDVGGQRELVTSDCGYLIPLGEPADEMPRYVAALKTLLENPQERQRKALACRARVVEHFPLEKMTQNFIAALNYAGGRLHFHPANLPPESLAREMATLAVDHLRVSHESALRFEHSCLLHERMSRYEKTAQKLERKLEEVRSTSRLPEVSKVYAAR